MFTIQITVFGPNCNPCSLCLSLSLSISLRLSPCIPQSLGAAPGVNLNKGVTSKLKELLELTDDFWKKNALKKTINVLESLPERVTLQNFREMEKVR